MLSQWQGGQTVEIRNCYNNDYLYMLWCVAVVVCVSGEPRIEDYILDIGEGFVTYLLICLVSFLSNTDINMFCRRTV